MMIPEEIIKLAQTEKKLLQSELDYKLFELKALNWGILECIMFALKQIRIVLYKKLKQ